jgi:hypothetical protein
MEILERGVKAVIRGKYLLWVSDQFQGPSDAMRKNISQRAPASSGDQWEQRFEAALLERDPAVLERRLQSAKDAILDRIEDSFDAASFLECQLLMAALNMITELQWVPAIDDLRRPLPAHTLGYAA